MILLAVPGAATPRTVIRGNEIRFVVFDGSRGFRRTDKA